jgi:PIN domain nuclease of toxin-antitoxin system
MGILTVRLLIDSHILLRLDHEPSLVPSFQRTVLADLANDVYVSAATAWELGIKQSKGKLLLSKPASEQRMLLGFLELPVTFAHAEYAAALPMLHKDPFDRMLVAQAIVEQMVLVTADTRLAAYPVSVL